MADRAVDETCVSLGQVDHRVEVELVVLDQPFVYGFGNGASGVHSKGMSEAGEWRVVFIVLKDKVQVFMALFLRGRQSEQRELLDCATSTGRCS